MASVLIAGCGYLGIALAEQLVADRDEVYGLRRHPESLPPSIRPLRADLVSDAPGALAAALPEHLDSVFYTAGASAYDDAAYAAIYVEGVRRLARALALRGLRPRRLVYASSTSVYAQADGERVDETSPTLPEGFAGRRVLEGEATARASGIACVVVRLGGIYGPGREGLLARVRRGAVAPEIAPPRYTNRIHRDDAAGALRHLLRLEPADPVYLAVDAEPAPAGEVARWLASQVGVGTPSPAPPSPAGAPAASPASTGLTRRAPGSKRCSNARLVASGYRFRYPSFREGYADLVSAGRTAGGGGRV